MNQFGGDINVKVDPSYHATKADIKNILHTSILQVLH